MKMEVLTEEQVAAVEAVHAQLYGVVGHTLVSDLKGAYEATVRITVDPLVDEIVTTDPVRREICQSLTLGLRYLTRGQGVFVLAINRGHTCELIFTLRLAQ